MNGLSNWIPYYATIDPKYIPIAATFLKNKIYQDFPPKENKRAVNDIKNQTYEDLREWVYGSDCSNNNDYVDQFCGKDSENDVIYE